MTKENKIAELLQNIGEESHEIASSTKELTLESLQNKISQNKAFQEWLEKVKELLTFDLYLRYDSGWGCPRIKVNEDQITIRGCSSEYLQKILGEKEYSEASEKEKAEASIAYLEQRLEDANVGLILRRKYLRSEAK